MKQTMMKSLLSLVLVAVLCVGAVLPVFAADNECPAQHDTNNCNYETVEVVEADCGEQGYTIFKCTACGTTFAGNFVSSNHEEYKVVDVEYLAPTCSSEGKTEGWHCTICDKVVVSETIPTAAHSWGNWGLDGADCSTATKEKRTCSVCGETETQDRTTPVGDHAWVIDKETFVAPTCITEGTATYKCATEGCGATKTGKVAAVGSTGAHSFGTAPVEIVKNSTCATAGEGIFKCNACGITEKQALPLSTTHAATEDLVATEAKAATCTTPGNKAGNKCPICDQFIKADGTVDETAIIPATGHNMGSEYEKQGQLSCTTVEIYVYSCTVCGEKATQIVGPEGHNFEADNTKSKKATCTTWGYTFKACTKCGYSESETIEPLNHSQKVKFELANDAAYTAVGGTAYKPQAISCKSYAYYYEYCKLCGANYDTDGETILSYNFDTFVKIEDKTGTLPAHTWSNAEGNAAADTKTVPSTCAEKGYTYNYCSVCDTEKPNSRVYLDLVDHAKEDPIYKTCTTRAVASTPNCINGNPGVLLVECTNCGLEWTEITIPAEHNYVEITDSSKFAEYGVTYNDPTCATDDGEGGIKLWACDHEHNSVKCTAYKTESVPTTIHTWTDMDPNTAGTQIKKKVAATCTNGGTHDLYICSVTGCDYDSSNGGYKDYTPYEGESVVTNSKDYHVDCEWDSTATTDLEGKTLDVAGYYRVCTKDGGKSIQVWKCNACANGFYLEAGHDWDKTGWVNDKPADYDDASCTEVGATGTYTCKNCGYIEKSTEIKMLAHDLEDKPADTPINCADSGYTAYKECKNCDYTEGKVEIKAHTDKITLVAAAKDPTCQATGITTTYYKCSTCNKYLTADVTETTGADGAKVTTYSNIVYRDDAWVKANVAPKADHTPKTAGYFCYNTADCVDFGFNGTDCQWCDYVFTTDYVPASGHNFVSDGTYVDGRSEPTCELDVIENFTCANNCGETTTKVVEGKKATGHITADPDGNGPLTGTVIFNSCLDTHKDRVCVNTRCDYANNVVPTDHDDTITNFAPTCYEYAYTLTSCSICGRNEVVFDENSGKTDHIFPSTWTVLADDNTKEERKCQYYSHCGVREVRSVQTLYFDYDVVNGVVAGADFVNSGIVELTISTSASELAVYGLGIVIKYNNAILSYMDAEVLSEAFAEVHVDGIDGDENAANGFLRVNAYASVPGADIANTTLNGEEALVTVRFRINPDATVACGVDANFQIDVASSSVTNKDGEQLNKVIWHGDDGDDTTDDTIIGTVNAKVLGNVVHLQSGSLITMMDATEMLRIITGESETEYMAEADIDKDGKITAADFAAMQKYLVSGDYEAFATNGIDAE